MLVEHYQVTWANQSELSRRTGVRRSATRDTVQGNAWPDSVTVMLLEDALGIDLWPARRERGSLSR